MSCLSQFVEHYDKISRLVGKGKCIDTVYLDFYLEVLDSVDQIVLLPKLKAVGLGGKPGHWIHSFLTDRTQVVTVNGFTSKSVRVISGVQHETVLGPIVFHIYIADINI